MASQLGLQTIAIHTSPNISQSKNSLTRKFRPLTEYYKRNIFLKKYGQNEALRLVPE